MHTIILVNTRCGLLVCLAKYVLGAVISSPLDDHQSQPTNASIEGIFKDSLSSGAEAFRNGIIPPAPHAAIMSNDTLSDTKVFILLAAIVFIFLAALGFAMIRVSSVRRRQQSQREPAVNRAAVSMQRIPETLNRHILDALPVFEVTESLKFRKVSEMTAGCYVSNLEASGGKRNGRFISETKQPGGRWNMAGKGSASCSNSCRASATPLSGNARCCSIRSSNYSATVSRYGPRATSEATAGTGPPRCHRHRIPELTRSRSLDLGRTPNIWQDEIDEGSIKDGSRSVSQGDIGSCPICLEEFQAGDHVRVLPCDHKYHLICIDTWLVSRSACCPYCKMNVRQWFYGPEAPDPVHRGWDSERGEYYSDSGESRSRPDGRRVSGNAELADYEEALGRVARPRFGLRTRVAGVFRTAFQ